VIAQPSGGALQDTRTQLAAIPSIPPDVRLVAMRCWLSLSALRLIPASRRFPLAFSSRCASLDQRDSSAQFITDFSEGRGIALVPWLDGLGIGLWATRILSKLLTVRYKPDIDSREQPLYTVKEAARYLGIDSATLTTWLYGRSYRTKAEGTKFWEPVITPASQDLRLLSFFNLAEAHILAATRYRHKVPFPNVRTAISTVVERFPSARSHPLLSHDFFTDGKYLFIQQIEKMLNISSDQLHFEQIMSRYLERVVRDEQDNPFKVFPLVQGMGEEEKVVSIISGVSSSRPVIDGTGVQVAVVWRRYRAGEEVQSIAEDLEIPEHKIRRAIDYVEWRAA
jgi:uncharacterized protein (DUF433 family)